MIISAHDILAVHDCQFRGCIREADDGLYCSWHRGGRDELTLLSVKQKEDALPTKPTKPPSASKQQQYAEAFKAFHALHGRWPIPIDSERFRDELPNKSEVFKYGGGWQAIWTLAGAPGLIPKGQGARNHLKTGRPEPELRRPANLNQIAGRDYLGGVKIEAKPSFATVAGILERAAENRDAAQAEFEKALAAFKTHPFYVANVDAAA